jgi:molecular chaperone Hsp33
MLRSTDSVLRAITDDGSFRVITARTTDTVRGVLDSQKASGAVAIHFGDLVTGSILVRETMAPQLRVQGILKGASKSGSLVADSHPDGTARGLLQRGKEAPELILGDGSFLQMMRTMPNGSLHQGIVEVPREGGVSAGLMTYMQQSEQVESVVAVGTVFEGDRLTVAGGYIVQLLPEAHRDALRLMTERLMGFPAVHALLTGERSTPRDLADALLSGMKFTQLEETPLSFDCRCSEDRVLASLATLHRAEIEEMRSEGKTFHITCDYCGEEYRIGPTHLDKILNFN